MFDLRALRYFLAIYEEGSVSAASRRCHIAQPSISAALKQLEEDLGVTLFERGRRGVVPTEAGRQFYPEALALVRQSESLRNRFRTSPEEWPLRLGLMRSLGAERMSGLLRRVLERAPVQLTLVNPEEPCDARIISRESATAAEAVQPIWHDRYFVALPAGHPLSLKPALALADLKQLDFIHRQPCDALSELERQLEASGIRLRVRAQIRTIEYAVALVAAGVGAALLPDWPEVRSRQEVVLRPLARLELAQDIVLAWPRNSAPTPALEALIHACAEVGLRIL